MSEDSDYLTLQDKYIDLQDKMNKIYSLLDFEIKKNEELSEVQYDHVPLNPYKERCDELKKFRKQITMWW